MIIEYEITQLRNQYGDEGFGLNEMKKCECCQHESRKNIGKFDNRKQAEDYMEFIKTKNTSCQE